MRKTKHCGPHSNSQLYSLKVAKSFERKNHRTKSLTMKMTNIQFDGVHFPTTKWIFFSTSGHVFFLYVISVTFHIFQLKPLYGSNVFCLLLSLVTLAENNL